MSRTKPGTRSLLTIAVFPKVFGKLVNKAELRVVRSPQRHPLHVVVAVLGICTSNEWWRRGRRRGRTSHRNALTAYRMQLSRILALRTDIMNNMLANCLRMRLRTAIAMLLVY
jgi:hypothetical protein